jgi:hypothetical protein
MPKSWYPFEAEIKIPAHNNLYGNAMPLPLNEEGIYITWILRKHSTSIALRAFTGIEVVVVVLGYCLATDDGPSGIFQCDDFFYFSFA